MMLELLDPAQVHLAIANASKDSRTRRNGLSPGKMLPQIPAHQRRMSVFRKETRPMSKLSSPADYEGGRSWRLFSFLPYLLILALTLIGVGYASISKRPLGVYWEVLAVITGVLCIVRGWPRAHTKDSRLRLVWTQALHWAAFLAIMILLLHTDVAQMLSADAIGLAILLILALGTFVAGVHTLSWQIGVLGVVEALAVPAIAWIEESALLLVLAAAAFIGLAGIFWWFGRRRGSAEGPV